VRAVPCLCEFYPGICLTTEEKARKILSQGKKNLSHSTVYILPNTPTQYKSLTNTHITKPTHTHTRAHTHTTKQHKTTTHTHTHTYIYIYTYIYIPIHTYTSSIEWKQVNKQINKLHTYIHRTDFKVTTWSIMYVDISNHAHNTLCAVVYCLATSFDLIHRMSQEEGTKLRESVPYVKIYRYNPKHLYTKLNGYGDNGQRKVWSSGGSTHCTLSADGLSHVYPRLPCQITEIPLTHIRQYSTMADCMSCIVLGNLKDNYDVSAAFFFSSI